MRHRLAALRAHMAESGIGRFYCTDLSNVKWLTGFQGVFDDEPAHALYVSGSQAVIRTDSRYADAARRAAHGTPWDVDASGGSHAAWALERAAEDGACGPLALEDTMQLAQYRALEARIAARADAASCARPVETSGFVRALRAVKDADEIRAMRAAQAVTDAAFEHIAGFMRIGMTEREVQLELEECMRRLGADDVAFSSIVASGANGAAPHSIPGSKRLEEGDMVVLDFGARKDGYCSDMTRTVCMGRASEAALRVFSAVRAANEAVEAMLAPGVTGAAAHALAEQVLADAGFAGMMGHGLGHGVGVDIHELPNLSPRNEAPLVPGNVVTVEPGVYLSGSLGCRLEDFGVITQDGFEVFTKSSHEPVII